MKWKTTRTLCESDFSALEKGDKTFRAENNETNKGKKCLGKAVGTLDWHAVVFFLFLFLLLCLVRDTETALNIYSVVLFVKKRVWSLSIDNERTSVPPVRGGEDRLPRESSLAWCHAKGPSHNLCLKGAFPATPAIETASYGLHGSQAMKSALSQLVRKSSHARKSASFTANRSNGS